MNWTGTGLGTTKASCDEDAKEVDGVGGRGVGPAVSVDSHENSCGLEKVPGMTAVRERRVQ